MRRLSLMIALALSAGLTTAVDATTVHNHSAAPTQASKSLVAKQVSGSFIGVDHPTSGQAKIVEESGVKYLELDRQFATDAGPDLKVILHNSATVNTKVKEAEYITLGALRSTKGSQRYQIPADIDLSNYGSVAIWCQEFNVTFGYASLK